MEQLYRIGYGTLDWRGPRAVDDDGDELGPLVPDTRSQAIADAYEDLKNAEAHPVDDSHVDKMRECLDFRLDALTQEDTDGS
jgi:hypothetical protein